MIRKADKYDVSAICNIYSKIHTAEEKGEAVIGWARKIYPTQRTAEEAILRDDMFVFELNEKIIGSCIINRIQVDTYKNAKWQNTAPDNEVMVLHTLAMDPSTGRKGYGTEMVLFYEKYAAENGCRYLRMDTNKRNVRARAMYKKLGYTEVDIIPCEFNGIGGVDLVHLEKLLKL